MKRITITMDDECHYVTKLFATAIDMSVNDLVNQAREEWIMNHPKFKQFENDFLKKEMKTDPMKP